MKEEFLGWFGSQIRQRHVDKDQGVSASSELFALACGPTPTPISVNSCVVNGVRFVMHSRDECRTTQNRGICLPSEDEEMYYGQLEEILKFSYMSFKTGLFRVKRFDTSNKGRVNHLVIRNNITQILENEDDPDIIHVDNSYDLAFTTSLNDLEIAALHIDGQSIDVDVPLDIIDVNEDDDIIDDEDVLPHELADSDDEDLTNVDDDGVAVVYSTNVARGHGGDGGGDNRPPPHELAGGCRGKGTQKPNLGGRKAGRMHTRKETRNLGLRKIMDELGPQPILFEWKDNGTMLPLEDWDEQIRFWSDPKNMARCAKNAQNRAKSTVVCRQGSLTLAALRDRQEEMVRLQGLGTYTDDQIMAMVRGGKRRRHILGVGRVLARRGKDVLDVPIDMITNAMSSDDRYSELFTQLQSQHESGSSSESGAAGDDESGNDEDADEDEEDVDS
ncbi:hypothetical protein Tco_0514800 [Tanacetum coccineum]